MATATMNRLQLEGRTIGEVIAQVNAALAESVPQFKEDGHQFFPHWGGPAGYGAHDPWPASYRWIACYAIHGGSEGYYIHIDAIEPPSVRTADVDGEKHRSVFLSFEKVWDKALAVKVAAAVATLFIDA